MRSLNNRGVHSENLRIFPNSATNIKMDYRQKMVVSNSQKSKHDDDDDEDLETLRMAALKSLRAKNTLQSTQQPALLSQPMKQRVTYSHAPVYGHRGSSKRGYYQNRPPRQNGNVYYHSRVNQNLIEIVPMEEDDACQKDVPQIDTKTVKAESNIDRETEGDSKFYRYKDTASGSEEEDTKESNSTSTAALTPKSERLEKVGTDESGTERDVHSGIEEDSPRERLGGGDIRDDEDPEDDEEEEEEEDDDADDDDDDEDDDDEDDEEAKPANDDDDDVLLMADLEEEDSLERLMDEMEREMNVGKPSERRDKRPCTKKEAKESRKINDAPKARNRKSRSERDSEKNGCASLAMSTSSSLTPSKCERRSSVSPRPSNRTTQKRRSLSPKLRLRKKSPRRSPRRSPPPRQKKMPQPRSPRRSSPLSRFSPRPRSPKMSPRPRSPTRRSPPLRKLSPRGRSPHSRSPRNRRSRSRSPRPLRSNRSRSPKMLRSRSPRNSPVRLSPRSRTPRSKSPPLLRRSSPRSTRISPDRRRGSPVGRLRSPVRLSPHRSPWSSPRNSPRLSPRRRRSPPKESLSRKPSRARPLTPDETASTNYNKRELSPSRENACASPEITRASKTKQRDPVITTGLPKDSIESNDPVFEARRRKFESNKPIDPIHDNKKIKLSKKDSSGSKRADVPEESDEHQKQQQQPVDSPKRRKSSKPETDEYQEAESDLCLTDDYVYEILEDVVSDDDGNESPSGKTLSMCMEMVPVKVEKERSKKKKKRDKEIYQVGKLKGANEITLSERIGKEKKCKKRKDRVPVAAAAAVAASPLDSSPEHTAAVVVQDLTVDEEGDLRTELSRRRAERRNRAAPIQSARLLQSAFKGVVNEVAKTNAKVIQRHAVKDEEKNNKKQVRRVTVVHRTDLPDSEEETTVVDSKVPVRFRLGINKLEQETSRESKATRKSSKRQGRKVKHKNNLPLTDHDRNNQ